MSATGISHLDKYKNEFEKHLGAVDELAQAILKGHLIVESALDNIIELMVFHPKHVQNAQLGFKRKVQLARALALRKSELPIWNLILSINAVRNDMSHSLMGERRRKKLDQLRRLYLNEAGLELREAQKNLPDHAIAMFACAMSTGFLGTLEDDTKKLRGFIDQLDALLNPSEERVPAHKEL